MNKLTKWTMRFIILFFCIALVGCAHLSVSSQTTNYQKQTFEKRLTSLKQIEEWKINGAFSIQAPRQSVIASYQWQQLGRTYFIRIQSSLNAYGIDIRGEPGSVTLSRAAGTHVTAPSPEQLMQQQLGWELPVSNLYYWLRGIPGPGAYQLQLDAYGHLVMLQQAGFTVHFSHYTQVGEVDLPQLLQLSNGRVAVRIIIKNWRV